MPRPHRTNDVSRLIEAIEDFIDGVIDALFPVPERQPVPIRTKERRK